MSAAKPFFVIVSFCLLTTNLFAQQQTFDMVTYTAPVGWTSSGDGVEIKGYSIVNKRNNTYCQVAIYKSMKSMGSAKLDFETDWTDLVVNPYKATNTPEDGPSVVEGGWDVRTGLASFDFNGTKSLAMLVTMSGFGKRLSVVVLTNTENYQTEIKNFLDSINPITPPEPVTTVPVNVNPQATTNDNISIVATWVVVRSDQAASMVNNGVAGHIKRQYTFNQDGTYTNFIKTFSYFTDLLLTRESGVYHVEGNIITITPKKGVIEKWSKKDNADKWGKLISSQNLALEKTSYQFTIERNGAYDDMSLILQSASSTQRDGPFDIENKWFYKLPRADYDFVKLPE